MARRFQVSRENKHGERITVEGCSSFDECWKELEKGIYQRDLQLEQEQNKQSQARKNPMTPPAGPSIEIDTDTVPHDREDQLTPKFPSTGNESKTAG